MTRWTHVNTQGKVEKTSSGAYLTSERISYYPLVKASHRYPRRRMTRWTEVNSQGQVERDSRGAIMGHRGAQHAIPQSWNNGAGLSASSGLIHFGLPFLTDSRLKITISTEFSNCEKVKIATNNRTSGLNTEQCLVCIRWKAFVCPQLQLSMQQL